MSFLLDTDVVSEWVKPRPEPRVVAWLAEVDEDRLFLSVVTLGELRQGVEQLAGSSRRDRLDAWLRNELPDRFEGRVLAVDATVANAWGVIVARRKKMGREIGVMDAFIAATADVHGLTVVTRNADDFRGSGPPIFDPWAEEG